MRKVIVSIYATLDGRVDDLPEWAVAYDDEAAVEHHNELMAHSDGLLLGRKTYEVFAGLWPALAGRIEYIDRFNSMAKYVASATLTDLTWENSQLIEGDVADGVAALKRQPGRDLVHYGCGALMHALLERDLIDEYRIMVHPVLLGKGPTLAEAVTKRVDLELVDSAVTKSGVAVLTYRPAASQRSGRVASS